MSDSKKVLKTDELPYETDAENDSSETIVDPNKKDYEYKMELELVKSTRDNFMIWKDYEY